jgi:hypothetical protein
MTSTASGGGGGGGGTGRLYFRDCGSLGKQMLTVDSSEALVRFKTGQASLAQRGFLLYFEGLQLTRKIYLHHSAKEFLYH